MQRLGHEFGPGTNPYKVTTESEKAWHKFLRTETWWPKRHGEMINHGWFTNTACSTGYGGTVGVVHIRSTCEGQGSFLYSGLSQWLLTDGTISARSPLTALVELQECTGAPLFLHGCQGSQLRSSRLKWVLFSKKGLTVLHFQYSIKLKMRQKTYIINYNMVREEMC